MKKILIVEDEMALLKVYVMLFGMQNFEVHEASNGKIALDLLDKINPDIIVLDILMPVMGGLEFLEVSQVKIKNPKTKILVLSNLSDPETLNRIKELGADKYLLKASVSPGKLVTAVNELLTV